MISGLVMIFAAAISISALADETQPPNFIVILCDNLGYGDIEPFGSTVHRTPHLNRMAREGRKFTHFCVSAGVCTPSRASLMTGCYAQRVGMHTNPRDGMVLRPISPYGLHPNEVTIAEILKPLGYATTIIGKWHLGDQPSFLPTRQGFDSFFGIPYSDDMTQDVGQQIGDRLNGSNWPLLPLMENEIVVEAPANRDLLTKRSTARALEFIEENKDQPFFLYLPQAMPGSTNAPFASPAFKGKSRNGPWGDSIEELDWSTGQILDKLVQLGIDKRTLVVWTSDNGAPMTDDVSSPLRGTNRPLHGRGYTTGEGAFRVPTIMWWPGKVPNDTVCDELATTMDLLPTFTRLAGGNQPPDRVIDGHDIRPLICNEPDAKSPYDIFYYYDADQLQAVRSGRWKLFLPLTSFNHHPHFRQGEQPRPLLFDVVEDMGSTRNLADAHPDIVQRLTELAARGREDLGDRSRPGNGQRLAAKIENPSPRIPPPVEEARDALQSIERTRTGRHWVDAKIDPPKSPEESRKCFQIEPGMKIELVAAEPLIVDPVAIAFDRRGRMLVVEYRDYPTGPPQQDGPPLSRVVMLQDTDGDGRMDRRHVFAEHLNFTHGLMAWNDGILVGAQTEIIFLKDTDGDHKADVREVLFEGFNPEHAQMQIGNPRWGLDNWITLNYGPGQISRSPRPDEPSSSSPATYEMPRLDFRFHPLTMEFGPDSGAGQYGNTVDNWGHRFFSWNRHPIRVAMLPYRAMHRNPFVVISTAYTDVAPSGGDAIVFPLVEMKSNWLSHAGTHTSACGVTAYVGDLLGSGFANSVFVCEPVGHLVTRSIVKRDGAGLTALRARPKADFLAATDMWFRPASLANGPDGALYLADMYRLYVEHPQFFPEDIAERLDWRAGDDRGRIWRITPESSQPRPFTPPETTRDSVALLSDPNGWRRYLGQRLLVERQAEDAAAALRDLLTVDPIGQVSPASADLRARARLHAMWTLDGLGELTVLDVSNALSDSNVYVRRDAIKLAVRRLKNHPQLVDRLITLSDDEDVLVRYQIALALGDTDDPRAADVLTRLALRDGGDHWFALAILTSAQNRSGAILSGLVAKSNGLNGSPTTAHIELVNDLASVVGARGDEQELGVLLRAVGDDARGSDLEWKIAALSGLAEGLSRHQGLGQTSLNKLISSPPERLIGPAERVRQLIDKVQHIAVDQERRVGERVASIKLLAYEPLERVADVFYELLATGQPVEVQLAAVEALRSNADAHAAEIVIKRWPTLGPRVRGPALALMFGRIDTTRQALEAMASGAMNPSAVSIEQRAQLLEYPDEDVRSVAIRIFGGAISPNRRQVANRFRPALELKGSAASGAKIFANICAKCHRLDGQGHEVGPDISDVRNRSREALLYDILDPNRGVNPYYTAYTVISGDGRIFNGLMTAETADAVVLRQAESKEQIIARADIEEIRASGKSLMPEGVEKEIDVQQMADLLEYLKARDRKTIALTPTAPLNPGEKTKP